MKVEVIQHGETGQRIPLIVDADGLPVPGPNEWLLTRRDLSPNTSIRNARELVILIQWLDAMGIDLEARIRSDRMLTEAQLRGGLIENLRHSLLVPTKNQGRSTVVSISAKNPQFKVPVSDETFNQRLLTVKKYLTWRFELELGALSSVDRLYKQIEKHKDRVEKILDAAFIKQLRSGGNKKHLNDDEMRTFKECVYYRNPNAYGVNENVKFRNYICAMIMLRYGLRPGEVLSLRVEDIVISSISELRVVRRSVDQADTRRPRPQIKRLGRHLIFDEQNFVREVDHYINVCREEMMEAGDAREHNYLIISDVGEPLHLNSLGQYFRIIRGRFSGLLPENLTAKMLRHTFSSQLERRLAAEGRDEDQRRQALAYWRGDKRLKSQDVYIQQEIVRQSNATLSNYHRDLIPDF